MHATYHAGDWQGFYAAVLAASAALEGLLFVALCVNVRAIMRDPTSAARAREVLGQLLVLLYTRRAGADPRTGSTSAGRRADCLGRHPDRGQHSQPETHRLPPEQRLAWIGRDMIFSTGTLLIPIAGITLIADRLGGQLWLVPTVLIYFLWSLLNAWTLVAQSYPSLGE